MLRIFVAFIGGFIVLPVAIILLAAVIAGIIKLGILVCGFFGFSQGVGIIVGLMFILAVIGGIANVIDNGLL